MHRESGPVINVLVGGLPRTLAASLEARLDGAAVHVVDSGAEALEWLAARSCQLLVLDHALPGVPAIDVVHALTEGAQASALSVLYCLHDASARQERERAERLGIRTFLTHPIDVDELAEKVRALTHGANGCRSGDPAAEGSAGACPKRRRRAWAGTGSACRSGGGSTCWTARRSPCSRARSRTGSRVRPGEKPTRSPRSSRPTAAPTTPVWPVISKPCSSAAAIRAPPKPCASQSLRLRCAPRSSGPCPSTASRVSATTGR